MLKITTIQESGRDVLLKLEGKITEQWAALLDGECRAYLRQNKAVYLDCSHVSTSMDGASRSSMRFPCTCHPGERSGPCDGAAPDWRPIMNVDTFIVTESMSHRMVAGRKPELSQSAAVANREVALLARLRQGDEGAFDEVVTRHHSALIRMAMGYVADREVAEEVVQDTWMVVIEKLGRFEGRSSLRTWIFGIMIHKAKDRGVREKRHTTFSSFESADDDGDEAIDPSRFHQSGEWAGHWAFPPQPWDDQTPEKLLASQQAVTAMNRAIEVLPRTLKDVLILRDVEGVEAKEVCHILKITETNLYVRLHRARERVRQAVETYLEGRPSAV